MALRSLQEGQTQSEGIKRISHSPKIIQGSYFKRILAKTLAEFLEDNPERLILILHKALCCIMGE